MKENYTKEEVLKIVELVGQYKICNLEVTDQEKELLREVGYSFYLIENGHGSYTITTKRTNGK